MCHILQIEQSLTRFYYVVDAQFGMKVPREIATNDGIIIHQTEFRCNHGIHSCIFWYRIFWVLCIKLTIEMIFNERSPTDTGVELQNPVDNPKGLWYISSTIFILSVLAMVALILGKVLPIQSQIANIQAMKLFVFERHTFWKHVL